MKKLLCCLILMPTLICIKSIECFAVSCDQMQSSVKDTVVTDIYSIPSPEEIMYYIQNDEIHYQKKLLNINSEGGYKSDDQAYLILGYNLADLSYCVSLRQNNKVINYFQIISQSARRLNLLPKEIDLIKIRVENNMSDIDSLKAIYEEVYSQVMNQLYESKRFNHFTIVSLGVFVESVYLVLNSSKFENSNIHFKTRIGDQQLILIQLNEMIDKYLDEKLKLKYQDELAPLNAVFQKFRAKASPPTSKMRYDGTVVISEKQEQAELNNSLFELIKEIGRVRNELIANR